ncbi:ATP-binding protein [Kocuria sp. p3-SID1433]|uniref:sensor histidine kinase n=1 Tax=unclassified Kocuria TaxID=2649579 RepID=UPI0021A89272|nr:MULTISPECIES: ATP-binding protein [unclassified Kocuria]MCT1602586.1 ATP-binding protein [Kocuria sp. p3-SID1428]MCT2180709.1 ATP-binding protein [Kocuria sp. p3-SID1433]
MTHAAEPPAQDFKRYHGRALRSRLPSPVSAGTMGPNVYRLQWMGQLCAAVAMFSSSLAALPSVSVLSGAPAVLSTLFFIGLQICTGLMFYFGARRRVLTWPSTAAVVLIMLCYASLAPIWAPAYEISPPWLSFLLILAAGLTAMTWGAIASLAVIGWALISLGVYAVQMPAGYPLQAEMVQTTADCLYAILLAMAIPLTLRAADNADTDYSTAIAHATALRRSRTQCDEQERLDRLIHDNVMAALLDASRAPGPVSKRTRELAMRALSVLEFEEKRATGIATTYVHTLMDELLDALTPWRSRVRFNVLVPDIRPMGHTRAFLPSDTGQALIHAVTESVSNSARHSGAATTFVTMDGGACPPTALNPFGFYLTFEVLDRGKGFQMRSMDSRRLGVRVSIIGNVENAGGSVDVASAPHRGTRIRILWPSDAHPSD